MNNNIKLIFSDIDGTILNSRHAVDIETQNAIKALKSKQIPFVLASARSPKGIEELALSLELESPMVSYNGALITKLNSDNTHEIIDSTPMDYDGLKSVVELIRTEFADISLNVYSGPEWYVYKKDSWVEKEEAITKIDSAVMNIYDLIFNEKIMAHKLLCIGETYRIQELESKINALSPVNTECYLSKENYLEVTASSVSKLAALLTLMNLLNIKKQEVMAIGDNYNDIPMLEYAEYGVAMKNAPDFVKQKASYLTGSNDDNGVAKAIHKFVK